MGNLNHRYRRGHHPHCLYLQWIYWGGITALIGWMFLLVSVSSQALWKVQRWEVLLLGACLLGYAFLEIFETAMKNPRVNALFWLNLTLLGTMVGSSAEEKIGVPSSTRTHGGRGIPSLAFLLPVLWSSLFSIQVLLSLGVILAAAAVMQYASFSKWALPDPRNPWGAVSSILGTLFLLGLYIPLVEAIRFPPEAVLIPLILGIGAYQLERLSSPRVASQVIHREDPLVTQDWPIRLPVWLALSVPILLGSFVMASFWIAGTHVPAVLKPKDGVFTALWLALVWWFVWARFSGKLTPDRYNRASPWFRQAGSILIVLSVVLGARFLGVGWNYLKYNGGNASFTEWNQLLERSRGLGLLPFERAVRKRALTQAQQDGNTWAWIHWAKDSDHDPLRRSTPPSLLAKFLTRGGKAPSASGSLSQATATGLAVDSNFHAIWVLYEEGQLVEITNTIKQLTLDVANSSFTHIRLDPQGHPLILRADGELLRFDGTPEILCPPTSQFGEVVFRRLCLDPQSGQTWSLDLYGNIYRWDPASGWIQDQRFLEVSRKENQTYDIARDLAITQDGTFALLDCYGQVWKSPIGSNTIDGPYCQTHFWPTLPLGQSIQAVVNEFILCDRYGGIYLTPYPRDRATLSLKGSYLFPRSLPREKQDIVDMVFLPEQRWVYLLTGSGRILTNHRWGDVWAE